MSVWPPEIRRATTHGRDPQPVLPRFLAKIQAGDGCWNWLANRNENGYGKFTERRHHTVTAHRFAYEVFVGPIPEGLQIDHLCGNRRCVNPAHLEPVTARENSRRTDRATAAECRRGHPFIEGDVYRGKRYCRECKRLWMRTHRAEATELGLLASVSPQRNQRT